MSIKKYLLTLLATCIRFSLNEIQRKQTVFMDFLDLCAIGNEMNDIKECIFMTQVTLHIFLKINYGMTTFGHLKMYK